MRKTILLFSIIVFITSCSNRNKVPKGILAPPKMQEVLWDMISAGEFLNGYVLNKDSIDRFAESSVIYGKVLQFHQVSRNQFEKSYLYYRQHPALMKIILDTLSKRQIPPEELDEKPDTIEQVKPVELADTLKKLDTALRKIRRQRM